MLDISEIKKQYPDNFHKFDRGLIREYLQYQILGSIFSHKLSSKLSFLGGTCLRIVHDLKRFSEDIDFDNKNLSMSDFEELGIHVKRDLEKLGFLVEIRFVDKGAFHCHIKFPELLFKQGLSPIEEEKILIRIDTFDQGVAYESEVFLLNKFDIFKQVLITPKSIILSQKLWTITQRQRLKGRDFYDIMFLLQNTKPNMKFLEAKFQTKSLEEVLRLISDSLGRADFRQLAKDVQPFLIDDSLFDILDNFELFLKQQLLR